ncbi:hypothetical protein NUSPORA_00976 [Nucleospora cyclopteri]
MFFFINLISADYFRLIYSNMYIGIDEFKIGLFHKKKAIDIGRKLFSNKKAYLTALAFEKASGLENVYTKILGVQHRTIIVKPYPGDKTDTFALALTNKGGYSLMYGNDCVNLHKDMFVLSACNKNTPVFVLESERQPVIIDAGVKNTTVVKKELLLQAYVKKSIDDRLLALFLMSFEERIKKENRRGKQMPVQSYLVKMNA